MKIQVLYVIMNKAGEYYNGTTSDDYYHGAIVWWTFGFLNAKIFPNRAAAMKELATLDKGQVFRVEIKPESVGLETAA